VSRADEERAGLAGLTGEALERRLLDRSGLPGPRGNLELVAAAVEIVDPAQLREWAALDADVAPTGTALEFLPVVGVAGIGRALVEAGDGTERANLLDALAVHAGDSRWRVREAVAMALQRYGATDMPAVVEAMRGWAGSPDRLRQRAAVAALCEPVLLKDASIAAAVVDVLDEITATVEGAPDRRSDPFRVLRQALGYGWSVAAVAAPGPGLAAMDRWLASADPDVRWVMRENLKKNRLAKLDPAWLASARARALG